MKILRIIARLNVGGPARHVVWLTKGLVDDEFESHLIAGTVPPGEEDMEYLAAQNGVEPILIAEMSRELSPKDAISLVKVCREIWRIKPDIIHTHTAKAGTVGRVAAFLYRWLTWGSLVGRPRRVRTVHTFHGHVFHSYYGRFKTGVFVVIERILARFATDKIIVITDQQRKEICEDFGVGRPHQFEVIRLGIDLELFEQSEDLRAAIRRELGIAEGEFDVGIVGRLTEIKNISMFLRSAARARTDHPEAAFRFVIVGDGHLADELRADAEVLNLTDAIVFAGNRTDVEKVYAGLDAVALTSLNEGTPLSLIEAMAARRPVVATEVGGVPDLLGEVSEELQDCFRVRERGIGVRSEDVEGFTKSLIYLAKNEKLRESFGRDGRIFVEKNYSKERLIVDIKKLYRKMAA
ncbi:MAG: glycosyltransferase [Blastocatellia bacterium]|nr:glycosyltransferase [Blastocatellia bacterium]